MSVTEILPKHYDPLAAEQAGSSWEARGYYDSAPRAARDNYSILLPPPNVTGTLHMGHAFQHTLMDALIRYQRMCGRNTLWQAGTDHAGIATQIVVSRALEQRGIDVKSLSREEFLKHAWAWKQHSGNTITRQMRRLGASCDWTRECFTMDQTLSDAVTKAFVRLYEDGYIYRGKRLINWDPVLLTAVSDLEVVSEEEAGTMYHVRYPFTDDEQNGVIIATTRPETILVDGAVAVHPADERFKPLLGRKVWVPLTQPRRAIEIIADEYVDAQFGSGCVKITAAHDFNDYEVYKRHPDKNIPLIILLTPEAKMNDNAPAAYRGLDRFDARRQIVQDLDACGLLIKQEAHRYKLPRGDRSGAVVEPMLTNQWFLRMDKMAARGLELAAQGKVRFIPGNWKRVYEEWLSNIHDWCISRQLMWGHQIPAWTDKDGNWYVAQNAADAQALAPGKELTRETDVLDTWFSSALWPFSTLNWHTDPQNAHFQAYFPTSVLVTGFDILFFWVARMVMMSDYFIGDTPFHDIYITGLVRDAEGQKMSKSRGNILDPLDLADGISLPALLEKRTQGLMNPKQAEHIAENTKQQFPDGIAAYGVDALRFTFASLASYGREIKFDLGRCEGYRHFCNKLWNAARFVLSVADGQYAHSKEAPVDDLPSTNRWIVSRLQRAEHTVAQAFAEYRFDLAALEIYQFFWDDYCSWYLETAKVQLLCGNDAEKKETARTLTAVLEAGLRLCHPIMPFITEQLWQKVAPQAGIKNTETIMLAPYPQCRTEKINPDAEADMARLKGAVEAARRLRREYSAHPATLLISGDNCSGLLPFLRKLGGYKNARHTAQTALPANAPSLTFDTLRLTLDCTATDSAAIRQQQQHQLQQLRQELAAVEKMLSNAQFIAKARPQAVEKKQQQKENLLKKIAAFER